MSILKKIRKSVVVRRIISRLISTYVRIVWWTSPWTFVGREGFQHYWDLGVPVIGCFWHGRLLMMLKVWYGAHKFHMLVSSHPDGEIINYATQHFGFGIVKGSSTRGGVEATRKILSILEKGESVGITPDGPKGPRFQAKISVIQIARLSGCVIFPVGYSTTRGKWLRSWDRFYIPFPFSRGVFVMAEPLVVKDSLLSDEELRQELEKRLNDANHQADILCGHVNNEGELP
ncbi:Lysophospholipid acyltransferase family protein [Candidatus Bealeia paramacronuclearis]|uniref:Lysophospholipid acyltransferase family protein n=1 Tax=Candidatus Bealeia paramacronuclearis TaxID=1921001 RepID=A0ABZ2C157_9PROT|nr:Lysophospholipid acyltransferase family protein [Candidatus Bealeia paramacronuclearis]